MNYIDFLKSKQYATKNSGFSVKKTELNSNLFDWQRDIDAWSLKKGKCALFQDCGLGKTIEQLAWADKVCSHTGGNTLILTPLAVARQTEQEGKKYGERKDGENPKEV